MNSWKSLLAQVAPTIATVLTGGNPLAGMAVKMLSDKVLGKPNGSESDIATALSNVTPEQLTALKEAEQAFAEKMRELDIQVDQLDVQDRASARDLAKTKGIWPQVSLSAVFIIGYFSILAALMFGEMSIPQALHDVLVALLATLSASVIQIMNFWFGSSHGSQKKDAATAQAALSR